MRSLLGRFHRPFARGTEDQLLLLNNLGDGSTLSLDFTTGVLDPRLTFNRDGGGTYVANDGYIYGMDLATSSSLAIGTGSKSVTLTATAGGDRRYLVGQTVWISNGTNNMRGPVTAYNASTQVLTINATATSGSGSFTSWTVGNASARFDHNPTTGTPRGLLIEGSAVNYMLESTSLSGYGNSNMVAISSGSETDPEGNANSAKQIYASATTGYHGWYRNVTAGTNTTVTVSIWAKARNYTFLFLSDLASGRAAVRFNLQTGATDNNFGAGYVSAKATPYTNGWWRCEMTVSVVASTTYAWSFVGVPTSGATLDQYGAQYTGTGNAADGIYCYGCQVEGGSGASSYIPAGASQGNRAGDSCALALSAIPLVTSEGSFVVRYDAPRANLGASGTGILNTDYQATEWIGLFQGVNSVTVSIGSWSNQTNISAGTVTSNIAAFSYGAWNGSLVPVSFVVNNSAVTNANRDWNPALPTWLMIGAASAAGSSTANRDYLNSCIRSVKYWPTRLPDAQLKSLTT